MNKIYLNKNIEKVYLFVGLIFFLTNSAYCGIEKIAKNEIEAKEFRNDELYISHVNIPISKLINQLQNRDIWKSFLNQHKDAFVYIDPHSGRPTSIMLSIPMIPGTGINNHITLESLSRSLGNKIANITENEIKKVVLQFLKKILIF